MHPVKGKKRWYVFINKTILFLFGTKVYRFICGISIKLRKSFFYFVKTTCFYLFIKRKLLTDNKLVKFVQGKEVWFYGEKESFSLGAQTSLYAQAPQGMRTGQVITCEMPYVCEIKNVECVGSSMLAITKGGF